MTVAIALAVTGWIAFLVSMVVTIKAQNLSDAFNREAMKEKAVADCATKAATMLVGAMGECGIVDYADAEKWLALSDQLSRGIADYRVPMAEQRLWELRRRSKEQKS